MVDKIYFFIIDSHNALTCLHTQTFTFCVMTTGLGPTMQEF